MIFHDDYASARARFRAAAEAAGFEVSSHDAGQEGPDGGDLTIDVAVRAAGDIERAVVVSSGTHGVEGYFGSAVQLDLLDGPLKDWTPEPGDGVVLVHAVNPYGFAHKRRVNEDNIDCNRNFVREGHSYRGAHDGYHRLDGLLNPPSPPGGIDPFLLKAGVQIARLGFKALKDAIAQGQYEYPQGVFYGGSAPSRSMEVLREVLPPILGGAERVVHLDLHTGSGRWGTYVLAIDLPSSDPRVGRLEREFGAEAIASFDPSGVLYTINGALGPWLESIMPDVIYDCLLAEFGTYDNIKVIRQLRFENRAVLHGGGDAALRKKAAGVMLETFCPADPAWRSSCVQQARDAVLTAMRHLLAASKEAA